MSIKQKLALGAFALATLPVLGAIVAGSWITSNAAQELMAEQAQKQLVAVRDSKRMQIEGYFQRIRAQIETFAEDRMIVDVVRQLSSAYQDYVDDVGFEEADIAEMRRTLADYYTEVGRADRRRDPQSQWDATGLASDADAPHVALQNAYAVANPHEIGSKQDLDVAENYAPYDFIHEVYHPVLRSYMQKFGFADILLADPASGAIVYSVAKRPDFATSLLDGPFAQSGSGEVFRQIQAAANADMVALDDFEPYRPALGSLSAFMATAIMNGNQKVGVLIFQIRSTT